MFNLTITTERLTLRPFALSDTGRVRALADNYDIAKMVASFPHPYPQGLAESWISQHEGMRASGKGYPFAIVMDGEVIGSIGVETECDGDFVLGYWLGEAYWNRGIASEAAAAALEFAFGWRNLPYVRACHIGENRASARVLAKAGFLATGRSRIFHKVRGAEVEIVHVILPRDAFVRDDSRVKQVYKAA